MKVAYITRKVFADDSEEIRIKHNQLITPTTIAKAQHTKKLNQIKREFEIQRIKSEISKLNLFDAQYTRKHRILSNQLRLRNIQNVSRSAHRSRQNLYDICRCNDFEYFVTWTFSPDKIERFNDTKVKRKFTEFQNDLHKAYPNMFYIAVPEYHKKGGLHFHLLIGGVTLDELKAVPAVSKRGRLIIKNGKQIYNVMRWKLGYSTLSVITNGEATKHYICKYISKQHLDERFFNKRRYYVSANIRRPEVEKYCTDIAHSLDGIDLNVYSVAYGDTSKGYAVLTHDGNGIVDYERNSEQTKQHIREMCAPTKCAGRCASGIARTAAPSGACPYSTLRTLDRILQKSVLSEYPLDELYRQKAITDEEYLREVGLID